MMMLGGTGQGKSTGGNRFVQRVTFATSNGVRSQTTKPGAHQSELTSSNGQTFLHLAIDTPGFGDSQGRDWEFIPDIVNFLKALPCGINLIALVAKVDSRFSQEFQLTFKMLHVAFGSQAEFWDHTAIVLTHCYSAYRGLWESKMEGAAAEWKNELRELGRECTGDPDWNYDPPVFFVDFDFGLIPTPADEQRLAKNRGVQKWVASSLQLDNPLLAFRGWQQVAIEDPRLHSIFEYSLFEEWTRSRPPISTLAAQMPNPEYFREKPAIEEQIIDEQEELFEDVEIEIASWEEKEVTEMRPVITKEKVAVRSTRIEHKTRVEVRQVERSVQHPGGCFSSKWDENVQESQPVTVEYTEAVPCDMMVEREVVKMVPEKHTKKVQGQSIKHKVKKSLGVEVRTVKVTRMGRQLLGWESHAKWTSPVWDETKTTRVVLKRTMLPPP
jgi:hypothetical protein